MSNQESAVRGFAYLVGGAFIVVAVEFFAKDRTLSSAAVSNAAVGAAFFLFGHWWPAIERAIGPVVSARISHVSSDVRWWLLVVGVVWMFSVSSFIIVLIQRDRQAQLIEHDMVSFARDIERLVQPRRLTPNQITQIETYLKRFRPYVVTLVVRRNDSEASAYASDIREAFSRGGWSVRQNHVDDVQEGLSTYFELTTATAQASSDAENPKADSLVLDAFRSVGVRFDGSSGSSSGDNITEDKLSIRVGARRRDGEGWKPRYSERDETR